MKNKINNIVAYKRMDIAKDFFWSDEMVELICILNFKKCITKKRWKVLKIVKSKKLRTEYKQDCFYLKLKIRKGIK